MTILPQLTALPLWPNNSESHSDLNAAGVFVGRRKPLYVIRNLNVFVVNKEILKMIFRLKDRFGLLTMHTPIRRCLQALTRTSQPTLSLFKDPSSLRSLSVAAFPNHDSSSPLPIFTNSKPTSAFGQWYHPRYFSSSKQDNHIKKEDIQEEVEDEDGSDDGDYDDEEEDYEDDDDDCVSVSSKKKVYTAEEKEAEATAIGYKVVGPLQKDDQVFKPYEPAFAVVQIGSHQFKVSNGDSIFTERLKFCEVNDKLILNKVLLLGSASQTIVGRPIVPDAAVHAVVEEHVSVELSVSNKFDMHNAFSF
ncbi:unnamed protein product [Vicia faba]|uniref:Large ribosomal subunit protein bL21m n=1 Tax=Vicia faba TaxID=3906 RepID=A0AAV1AYV1_VICFA|nr:unnamed protein product [Vicia faba]